ATEGMRAPIANLRAAAETLSQNPGLPDAPRSAFQKVVLDESMALSNQLEALARGYRELGGGRWMMAEIYSSDLIASLVRRLAGTSLQITAIGLPDWLYGDSLSLLVLLDLVMRQLHEITKAEAVDIAVSRGENRVYLDVIWRGEPISAGVLESWLNRPLIGGVGALTRQGGVSRPRRGAGGPPAEARPGAKRGSFGSAPGGAPRGGARTPPT